MTNLGFANKTCIDSEISDNRLIGSLEAAKCHGQGGNQYIELTMNGELRVEDFCMDFDDEHPVVKMLNCHEMKGNQHWIYEILTKHLIHFETKKCLTVHLESHQLIVENCNTINPFQMYKFQFFDPEKILLTRN